MYLSRPNSRAIPCRFLLSSQRDAARDRKSLTAASSQSEPNYCRALPHETDFRLRCANRWLFVTQLGTESPNQSMTVNPATLIERKLAAISHSALWLR